MKFFILMIVSFMALPLCFAEVAQHDESALESDLGFRWEDGQEVSPRDVASEKGEEKEEESEREVASDGQQTGIQFWKYDSE